MHLFQAHFALRTQLARVLAQTLVAPTAGSTTVAPWRSKKNGFRDTSLEAACLLEILVSAEGIEPSTY